MLICVDYGAGAYQGINIYSMDDECIKEIGTDDPAKDFCRAVLFCANLKIDESIIVDPAFKLIHKYAPGYKWNSEMECVDKNESEN